MKLWGPSNEDNFRNRRNLAFWSAIYSLAIWPNFLLLFHLLFDLEVGLIKALLTYVATIAGTSIGLYLWSAFKTPVKKDGEE